MRPEGYSARQAAKVCGIGRATVQRALNDGRLQGKKEDGVWVIAPQALEAAGFLPRQTFEQARIVSLEANVRVLEEQLRQTRRDAAGDKARSDAWMLISSHPVFRSPELPLKGTTAQAAYDRLTELAKDSEPTDPVDLRAQELYELSGLIGPEAWAVCRNIAAKELGLA